mmetsp:Transcript_12839/g.37287  ORF Transcript_12839/g.37287 Transcript_12839/m.37287 type:complete len:221 (+) Transcript_12839:4094-4756(+)
MTIVDSSRTRMLDCPTRLGRRPVSGDVTLSLLLMKAGLLGMKPGLATTENRWAIGAPKDAERGTTQQTNDSFTSIKLRNCNEAFSNRTFRYLKRASWSEVSACDRFLRSAEVTSRLGSTMLVRAMRDGVPTGEWRAGECAGMSAKDTEVRPTAGKGPPLAGIGELGGRNGETGSSSAPSPSSISGINEFCTSFNLVLISSMVKTSSASVSTERNSILVSA